MYGDCKTTCLTWGIETGNGWFFLLDALCRQIQNHINQHNDWIKEYGKKYYDKCKKEKKKCNIKKTDLQPIPQVVAVQIKEKFGMIRFYYNGGDNIISGMVRLAEELSDRICEDCGVMNETVVNTGKGWVRTLCLNCRPETEKVVHNKALKYDKKLITAWNKAKNSPPETLKEKMERVEKVEKMSKKK